MLINLSILNVLIIRSLHCFIICAFLVNTDPFCRFVIEVTGEPFPAVTWYFNSTPIEPGPRIQIIFEENICTLLILNTVLDDSGTYVCEAKNDSGVTTCTSTLHITRKYNCSKSVKMLFFRFFLDFVLNLAKVYLLI